MLNFKRLILLKIILVLLLTLTLNADGAGHRYDFQKADRRALSAPASVLSSTSSLAQYLTGWTSSPYLKTRAIFRWITANISYDTGQYFSSNISRSQEPADVFKSGYAVCAGYANLFQLLAEEAGLEVVTIDGYSKGYGYDPTVSEEGTNHSWNGVKIDGKWYLLDSTWAAGYIDNQKLFKREYNDFYFFPQPDEIILSHLPEEDRWQFLSEPVSREDFFRSVKVWPRFFRYGISLASHKQAIIETDDSVDVILNVPEEVVLSARLEKDGEHMSSNFTFVQREGNKYIIKSVFPDPGTYQLIIFGRAANKKEVKSEDTYQSLIKYRIDASSGKGDKTGFPERYGMFIEKDIKLETPLTYYLKPDKNIKFSLYAPGALDLQVIQGDDWYQLTQNGSYFTGAVPVKRGELVIAAQYFEGDSYHYLLRYMVEKFIH